MVQVHRPGGPGRGERRRIKRLRGTTVDPFVTIGAAAGNRLIIW